MDEEEGEPGAVGFDGFAVLRSERHWAFAHLWLGLWLVSRVVFLL